MATKQDIKAQRQFDAVLAKNNIARQLRDWFQSDEPISPNVIYSMLLEIEEYTGQMNQPSVTDIIKDDKGWL